MAVSSWLLFAAAAAISTVQTSLAQLVPEARSGAGCVAADQKIYCYGGRSYSNNAVTSTNMNDFYALDVSKPFTLQEGQSTWQSITAGGLDPAPNFLFGFVNLPGSNDILMQGGLGYDNGSAIPYQTVVYDLDTNAWRSIDTYGVPQVYQASLVALNQSMVVRYGGVSDLGTGYTLGDFYPATIYLLDYKVGQWYYADVPSEIGARCLQAAFLGNDGVSIYYIGGLTATPTANYTNGTIEYSLAGAPMNQIISYNTVTYQWSIQQTTSVTTPPARRVPTATPIPGTNNAIVYGGADLSLARPLADYLYILDVEMMAWTRINPSGNGAGPRYAHDAVLINNSSLFILFGIDNTGASQNDFNILDINTWSWQTNFMMNDSNNSTNDNSTATGDNGENGSSDSESSGGVSGGIIAGAVVGSVAGAGIICGLLAFFLLRKRRQNKGEESQDGAEKHIYQQDYDSHDHDAAAVAPPPPPRYDNNISPSTSSGFHMAPPAPGFHSYDNQSSSRTSMVTSELSGAQSRHNNAVENMGASFSAHQYRDSFSVTTSSEGMTSVSSPIRSEKPDGHIISMKPDIAQEEGNVPTLKLQPMRPDGE